MKRMLIFKWGKLGCAVVAVIVVIIARAVRAVRAVRMARTAIESGVLLGLARGIVLCAILIITYIKSAPELDRGTYVCKAKLIAYPIELLGTVLSAFIKSFPI